MTTSGARSMIEPARILAALGWYSIVVLVTVQGAWAILGAHGVLVTNGIALGPTAEVMAFGIPGPTLIAQVPITTLPSGPATVAGLLWLASAFGFLPVLWQVRRILRGLTSGSGDRSVVRRARTVAPLLAVWAVVAGVCTTAASFVVAGTDLVPQAQPLPALEPVAVGLAAAAGAAVFTAILRRSNELREDQELTV